MSSAGGDIAGEPTSADSLPPLSVAQVRVTEAPPDPAPGPIRDQLASEAAARVDRATRLMERALAGYNRRLEGVVAARLRSPKTRKGTRWWVDRVDRNVAKTRGQSATTKENSRSIEVKALDPSYILPERVARDELYAALRPVGLRIVADATSSVARQLRRPNIGLAAFSQRAVDKAVDSAVGRMLEINARHARDVRAEILGADATAESLDAAIDRVIQATHRGGKWLLIAGRTLATALAGDAALAAAAAMGVTHTQWISRRDGRVRETHAAADGQRRAIGEPFHVGGFRLRHPGDPSGLPASAPVVYGCRCGLLFAPPDAARSKAVALAEKGDPRAARALLSAADVASPPPGMWTEGSPDLGSTPTVPAVTTPASVVGYRRLDADLPATPGQRISWPGALALALAPAAAGALALAVVIPAGTTVGVAAGGVVLPAAGELEVLAVTAGQATAQRYCLLTTTAPRDQLE